MNRDQRILEEVEETLRALDDLPKLESNPFLFTRLQARLAQEHARRPRILAGRLQLKPVAIALVIILNVITFAHLLTTPGSASSRDQLISTLRQEYHAEQTAF
jgi:hypothetical protein